MTSFKIILLLFYVTTIFTSKISANVSDRKLNIGAFTDVGQLVSGYGITRGDELEKIENLFLLRSGMGIVGQGSINKDLNIKIGMGVLFWKPTPENSTDQLTKVTLIGSDIVEATATYDLGDNLFLKMGYLKYKYNTDAVNLGEYLFRSEAYPSIVNTGGWVWINNAHYRAMGFHLHLEQFSGKLSHDFLLLSEMNQVPLYDVSPAYVMNYKPLPFLEFGMGSVFHRFISVKPSITTPKQDVSRIKEYYSFPEVQNIAEVSYTDTSGEIYEQEFAYGVNENFDPVAFQNAVVAEQSGLAFGEIVETKLIQEGSATGYRLGNRQQMESLEYCHDVLCDDSYDIIDKDSLRYVVDVGGALVDTAIAFPANKETELTFKSIKFMARFSWNISYMLDWDSHSHGNLKLFGEAAILGWQNQPLFYENRRDRIPLMVGLEIPTFGFLDLLVGQLEYFPNPFPNDVELHFKQSLPIPKLPGDGTIGELTSYHSLRDQGEYKKDDFKWTIYARKTFVPGFSAYAQVAHDYLRLNDRFTVPSAEPLTNEKGDWYYLFRLEWGI